MRHLTRSLLVLAVTTAVGACSAAPRVRPVKMGDVDTGTGSVESVRRQLTGTWQLTSYEVYQSGKPQKLNADGQLTYDEFGNLTLRGGVHGAGESKPSVLNFSGRAVIDVTRQEIRFEDVTSAADRLPQGAAQQSDPEKTRKYVFNGADLTLTTVDASGAPTAVTRWKKKS